MLMSWPSETFASGKHEVPINKVKPMDNSGLQANLTFPDYLDYVDDTLIIKYIHF